MSPEKAKVFVVEDDTVFFDLIVDELKYAGHEVVKTSRTLEEALEAVGTLTELGVQVAILDANLSENDDSGKDGRRILGAIRRNAPEIKTIGFSMNRMEGVDVDLGKHQSENVARVVTEI